MLKRFIQTDSLVSLIGSSDGTLIYPNGNIILKDGTSPTRRHDSNGDVVVIVESIFGLKEYKVLDLLLYQFKGINISLLSEVISFPIDGDKNNTTALNTGYRFKNIPFEIKEHPGYFYIPGFPNTGISKDGTLINLRTGKNINWQYSYPNSKKNIKGGYALTYVTFSNNVRPYISRHRALLLAFTDYPDNVDNLVVNHLNGIPGDDRLENLEFVSYSENNKHAYVNNLKNQHHPILVRNALTGDVTEYYSVCEAARKLDMNSTTLDFRLNKCEFSKVFQDGLQFKLKSDERDWIIPDEEWLKSFVSHSTVVVGRNILTKEEMIFKNRLEAAAITGTNGINVYRQIVNRNGWQFKSENSEWLPMDKTIQMFMKIRPEVIARRISDDIKIVSDSISKLSTILKLNKDNVAKCVYSDGSIICDGWIIRSIFMK